MRFVTMAVLVFPVLAIAQTVTPTPSGNHVLDAVTHASSAVPSTIPVWLIGVLGVSAEFLVRAVPTAKPRSILLLVSAIIKAVAGLFEKASALLDMVVQNVKDGQ